jgi:hypothetical protein
MTTATGFEIGSLVVARGREWVVLPESQPPEFLVLRPLGGSDDERAGVLTDLEQVQSAQRRSQRSRLPAAPLCAVRRRRPAWVHRTKG